MCLLPEDFSADDRVRVAFGEQVIHQPRCPTDEPLGKGGAFAPIPRDDEHLENGPRGARAPVPRLYGSGRPAFSPPTVLRGRGRIFPAPARGNPAPRDKEHASGRASGSRMDRAEQTPGQRCG